MTELFAYLFSAFVYAPIQAELLEKLGSLPSPELVASARNCLSTAGPALLERAQNEWGWVAFNVIGINVGVVEPVQLLSGVGGECERVITAMASTDAEG
ncbi:hypothetical protein G6L37_04610 [Agrobacterium rubi]|nr:hypothetical protein [Agrobacterium rubi]NTF24635.1 hypothetical protein [Agrobacterium rubi]